MPDQNKDVWLERASVDGVGAMRELLALLDECVPLPGEPSFTLLGRDPQAPRIVEMWASERNLYEGTSAKSKTMRAFRRAADMRAYKEANPNIGMPISKMSSTAQMGYDQIKNDGTITLHGVFNMKGMNRHMTALNIYRGPSEYLIHLMDGASMSPTVGFLSKEDLTLLRDRLDWELFH